MRSLSNGIGKANRRMGVFLNLRCGYTSRVNPDQRRKHEDCAFCGRRSGRRHAGAHPVWLWRGGGSQDLEEPPAPEPTEAPDTTGEAEPEGEPAPAPEESEPAPSNIRQEQTPSFATEEGGLITAMGNSIPLSFPEGATDGRVIAPCCENLALVEYTSATYNEEWQTYEDEQQHLGFVDGQGSFVFSLDSAMEKYGAYPSRKDTTRFNDGIVAIALNSSTNPNDPTTTVFFDTDGTELFAVEGVLPGSILQGGVATIATSDNRTELYDKTGQLLYSSDSINSVQNAGLGYVMDYGETVIFDYQGNTIFDASSIAAEGAEEINVNPVGVAGIVNIYQERDGAKLYGVYSISLGKWLIEPAPEPCTATYADEQTVSVHYSIREGVGSHQFGLMDLNGNWLMDLSELPASKNGDENNGTTCYPLGNGWFATATEYSTYSRGNTTGSLTVALVHADDGLYELEDCDALVNYDLEDDLNLPYPS